MKNIAIILARSGSKGLPNKNIRPLNGVPLLAYSVKAAVDSGVFDTVMVSTDSEEYAEIARKYGAEVPFLRSAAAAGDKSSSWTAVREVLDKYEEMGRSFDMLALLQPTSPLRTATHLREAYELMCEKNAKAISSVCENEMPTNALNYVPDDLCINGFCEDKSNDQQYTPRQKLQTLYRLNGAIYYCKVDAFRTQESIYDDACYAYIMDRIHSVDVDDLIDFQMAEAIVQYLPEYKDYFTEK